MEKRLEMKKHGKTFTLLYQKINHEGFNLFKFKCLTYKFC